MKVLLSSLAVFLVLGLTSPAAAKGQTRTPASASSEARQKAAENRKNTLTAFMQRKVKVLNAHVTRLEKISDRVQSKINKLKEKGAVTTNAQAQLDATKTKIAQAKADTAKLEADYPGIISSNEPKIAFQILKTKMQAIKRELVDIRTNLSSSLGLVRGLSEKVEEEKDGE